VVEKMFAVRQEKNARQTISLPCVEVKTHGKLSSLPCAREKTHGKDF
jgi:hypothetical protein